MSPVPAEELQLGFGFADAPDAYALPDEDDSEAQTAVAAADLVALGERLLERLRTMGLQHIRAIRLTRNRAVLVSVKGFELRVHAAFAEAPEMHEQIVRFVMARRKWERQAARAAIVAFQLPPAERLRAPERTHPDDEPLAERLAEWHTRFNGDRFGAALAAIPIRISRRMKRRLGHYAPGEAGEGPEIAISARHVRRDGIAAAVETLLHEMVHQWQHESGLPLDHGPAFRRKCREVGAVPRAKRAVG